MEKKLRMKRDKGGYLCDDSPESFMHRALADNRVNVVDDIVVKGIGQGYGRLVGLTTEQIVVRTGPFGLFRRTLREGVWCRPVGRALRQTYRHYDNREQNFSNRSKTWVIKKGHNGKERITTDEALIQLAREVKRKIQTSTPPQN